MANFLRNYWPALLLAVIVCLIFSPALTYTFVHLDDTKYILDNHEFNKSLANIPAAFTHWAYYPSDISPYYRPFHTLTYMFGTAIGDRSPGIFRGLNIILHAIAVILFYLVLLKLGFSKLPSFIGTLLFALHPALAITVAWIPGSNDLLLAMFLLSSFLAFLSFSDTGRPKFLALHTVLFFFALLTKETAVFFPFALFLFLYAVKCEPLFSKKERYLFAGWSIALLSWYLLRASALSGITSFAASYNTRNLLGLIVYIGKTFFPFDLKAQPILQDSPYIWGLLSICLASILGFLTKKTRLPLIFFGIGWFLIFLLPSLFARDPSSIAIFMEHRLYVPLMGIIIAALALDIPMPQKYLAAGLGITLALLYVFLALRYMPVFKNREAFWDHVIATSPHLPKGYGGRARAYYADHDLERAESYLKKGIALSQKERSLHHSLALVYFDQKRFPEAAEEFKKELVVDPQNTESMLNLGVTYYMHLNDKAAAGPLWENILKLKPDDIKAHEYLAIYSYEVKKDIPSALSHIEAIIAQNGNLQPGLIKLWQAYSKK